MGSVPEPTADGELFGRVERGDRLSDKVADQLLQSILSQRLAPGSRLPSERELGERFGVSRTVIREAVRGLAARGVLEVHSGSGVRVAHVDASAVSASMSLFLRWRGPDYAQIHEARLMLELQTARLAAERATPEDVEALEQSCARFAELTQRTEDASHEDVQFHRLVAEASHNPLFLVMLDSIGDVLLDIRRATLQSKGRVKLVLEHHREIQRRIAAGDAAGAEAAMREHLTESDEAWRLRGSQTAA